MLAMSSPPPSAYQPLMSSPLAHQPSSPIATVQAKRAGQYKSRARASRRVSAPTAPEPTAKTLLRERVLARAKSEAQRARERARARGRSSWSDGDPSSSDGDVPMDADDDDDDDDPDNELLIGRIIATENRRARRALALSYEHDVGSSPGVPEDVLEEYFTAEEPPDEDVDYAALYDSYVQELAELEGRPSTPQEPADSDMLDDFGPVTPDRQTIRPYKRRIPRISEILSQCPSCELSWHAQDMPADSFTCPQCALTLPPEDVSTAWHIEHGYDHDMEHRPLAAALSDGAVLICASRGCDWLFAL